jgi:hypothetical protein
LHFFFLLVLLSFSSLLFLLLSPSFSRKNRAGYRSGVERYLVSLLIGATYTDRCFSWFLVLFQGECGGITLSVLLIFVSFNYAVSASKVL